MCPWTEKKRKRLTSYRREACLVRSDVVVSLYLWHKDEAEGQTADRAVRAPYLAVGAAMCWAQRPLQQRCMQFNSAQFSTA